jgi:hypothetical protein
MNRMMTLFQAPNPSLYAWEAQSIVIDLSNHHDEADGM